MAEINNSLKSLPKIDGNICSACGGACCRNLPGTYAPSDFGRSRKEILKNVASALDAGTVCIDCWEGDLEKIGKESYRTAYFIRPPTINSLGKRVDYSWGGACSNLTSTGCSLLFENRPMQCRELIPVAKTFNCKYPHSRYTRIGMTRRWLSFSDELSKLANI